METIEPRQERTGEPPPPNHPNGAIQAEVNRTRSLSAQVQKHATKVHKTAGRIADSMGSLRELIKPESLPAADHWRIPPQWHLEVTDLVTLWSAVADRLDVSEGAELSTADENDAAVFLGLMAKTRSCPDEEPPLPLYIARATGVLLYGFLVCGSATSSGSSPHLLSAAFGLSAAMAKMLDDTAV